MQTLFIGHNTIRLPIVDSTNTIAQDLVKQGKALEGTIVRADDQRLGRGQRGSIWLSEPGKNLTFSLVLFPKDLFPEQQFVLTQLVSLALRDFVASQIKDAEKVKIKWPNDIYVGNKKIAGVLIENSWRGNEIGASIIGIGININQEVFATDSACSLKQLIGAEVDLDNCFLELCSYLERRYLQFINNQSQTLRSEYHKNLFQLQQVFTYEISEKKVQAKIIGVSNEGKLQLSIISNFQVLELGLKEVKFIVD